MAQTNYTPISLYYSTTASAVPTAGNLVNGELAINITDGKLYYKSNAGVVTLLAGATGGGPAGGSNTQVQFNSSGILAGSANMTFDGTTLTVAGLSNTGNTTLGNASADTVTVNGTITSNLIFTDNTYDIGASGATRPRSAFLGTNLTVGNNITVGTAAGSEYIIKPGTDTATGKLQIQAGLGSSGYGGGLVLFSHSNATNPGWVIAGLSSGAAAKFAVNTQGLGGGVNVFTVDPTGLGYFANNVAIGNTPTTWTGAYALSVGSLANFGQRTGGNADLVTSWNAKWSGNASGAGYTYLATGDVASTYEQNGSHRFYTATSGTAGGVIPMLERFAVQNSGIVQSYVNTIVGVVASGGMSAQTGLTVVGGVDVNDNSPGVLTLGSHGNARTATSQIGKIDFYSNDASGGASGVQASIRGVTLGSLGESAGLYFYTGTAASLNLAGAINDAQQWTLGGSGSPDSNAKLTLYTSSSATGLSIYEQSTGQNARLRLSQGAGAAVYDATYSSGTNAHVFQIGGGTVATFNSSGNLLFATASNFNTIGMPQASAGYGISWERYGNVFGEFSSGATYISSNYYPTVGASGYKTTVTATYGAAGISVSGTGGPSNGGQITFLADLPAAKTAGNTFLPTSMGNITGYGTTLANYSGHGANAVLTLNNGYGATGDTTACIKMNLNGGTGGGYLWGYQGDTTWTHNMEYIATTGNVARDATASQIIQTGGDIRFFTNTGLTSGSVFTPTQRAKIASNGNYLQTSGRSSSAYGLVSNVQEWTGQVTSVANGASFSLFAINGQYDMLCYDLNIFCNTGGFFAYKSAGIFGYNGFTNNVLASSCSITITKTGTLYNETMTLTNTQGSTVNEYVISLRVWGYSARNNVSDGGQDMVTSSYLVRLN